MQTKQENIALHEKFVWQWFQNMNVERDCEQAVLLWGFASILLYKLEYPQAVMNRNVLRQS